LEGNDTVAKQLISMLKITWMTHHRVCLKKLSNCR
jgi:hypothetical protein